MKSIQITRPFTAVGTWGSAKEKNLVSVKAPSFDVTETLPADVEYALSVGWNDSSISKAMKQQTQIEYRPSVSAAYFGEAKLADIPTKEVNGRLIVDASSQFHRDGIQRALAALSTWSPKDIKSPSEKKSKPLDELGATRAIAAALEDSVVVALIDAYVSSPMANRANLSGIGMFYDDNKADVDALVGT